MATDPETTQKLPMNRRDAMRAIAFGAAGVTLAACGGTERKTVIVNPPPDSTTVIDKNGDAHVVEH